MAKMKHITKSDIKNAMQCLKLAFYKRFKPAEVPEVDPYMKLLAARGNTIGEYAQTHFDKDSSILLYQEGDDNETVAIKTELALKNPQYKTLFEAAFLVNGVYVRCDILNKANSGWEIIEVKSGSSAEEEYKLDAAIQYHVVNQVLKIANVHLWYINKECALPDVTNLFVKESIFEFIDVFIPRITETISRLKVLWANPVVPLVDIGEHCNKPNSCPLKEMCFQKERNIPEVSVFDVPRIGKKAFEYYRRGIVKIEDLDPASFTEIQGQMIDQTQKKELLVKKEEIIAELKTWQFPLYQLDVEAMEYDLPGLANTRPGEQVAFQFSLHVINEPGGEIVKLTEYLHKDGSDPRMAVVNELSKHIGPTGSIVAFNKSYERSKFEKILEAFPLQAKNLSHLKSWCDRFVDPLPIFRKFVYHPDFQGSFSIKYVGPALVGDAASYADLAIKDGTGAVVAFKKMIAADTSSDERQHLYLSLLQYCDKDTWVMASLVIWLYKQADMWP